ncbi:unnamed protein product [Linum trigynum]|uniref:Uncharacterized protein n=1 Tax=Linum trigynum TaxID=586398 RepID=A0AAV2FMI6_9ROSI
MSSRTHHLLVLLYAAAAAFHVVVLSELDYVVVNNAPDTPGGGRFMDDIGVDYARSQLSSAADFVLNHVFLQHNATDRRGYQQVKLFVNKFNASHVAYTGANEIYFSADFIGTYSGPDLKREFSGLLYREMAHVWQWNGGGKAPFGLVEGIAGYVRLKAGLAPEYWVGPGGGERWDQGLDVTARFVEYCEGVRKGFVAEMNRRMKVGYGDGYFEEVLGKEVEVAWRDYKSKYAKKTKTRRGR